MSDDHEQRTGAGQAILDAVGGLTPGEARRLAIRHSDAFSPERQVARVRARAVARALGIVGMLDALIRDAARLPELPAVAERSQDAARQVATDAAVVALLGEDLEEEPRTLLAGPWARATRRRRSTATTTSAVSAASVRAAPAVSPGHQTALPGFATATAVDATPATPATAATPAIVVLGRDTCPDTVRALALLDARGVPHEYLHVDQDAEADAWIRRLNDGDWRTPTIVIGDPERPSAILREPSDPELLAAIGLG